MNLGIFGKKEKTLSETVKSTDDKYLEILLKISNTTKFPFPCNGPDLVSTCELITAEYLDGAIARGSHGEFIAAMVLGITLKGREYLKKLMEEQRVLPTKKEIFSGLKWVNKIFITALITSIITAIVTILISHWFTGRAPSP